MTVLYSRSNTHNSSLAVLIAARIIWSNRRVRHFRAAAAATSHWEVVETLIQSAAIYSAALASLLGTYLANSNAQYVVLDILQPLIVSPPTTYSRLQYPAYPSSSALSP